MFNLFFFIILIVAIVLRILFLDKPSGLWYDELAMYNEAVMPCLDIVKHFLYTNDIHLPLYQIFLHFWIKIFGNSDIMIRGGSVLFGILTVISAFFTIENKSYKNLLCILLFSINSFLIYYSQEVKMYSFLVFFATLNIVLLSYICKRNKGYFLWILSCVIMIYTYTTSIAYIFCEIIIFYFYKNSKKFLISSAFVLLFSLPYILYLIKFYKKYSDCYSGVYSDYSSLIVVFQNFLTPKLVGIGTNPVNYLNFFFSEFNITSVVFIVMPIGIAFYFIIKSLFKSKFNIALVILVIAFLFINILAFKFTNYQILSRFLIFLLPILLILFASGFEENNNLHYFLVYIYIVINMTYLIFSPNAAFKIDRNGLKPVVMLLNVEADSNDIVVVWNDINVLNKYLKKKIRVVSVLEDFAYRNNFILDNESYLNKLSLSDKKYYLRRDFEEEEISSNIKILLFYIYSTMKPGNKLFITENAFFDKYDRKLFFETINDDKLYDGISFNNLLSIKTLLDIIELSNKNLKFINKFYAGDFVVYEYQKI